jgi:hypothetical protein
MLIPSHRVRRMTSWLPQGFGLVGEELMTIGLPQVLIAILTCALVLTATRGSGGNPPLPNSPGLASVPGQRPGLVYYPYVDCHAGWETEIGLLNESQTRALDRKSVV